MSTEQKNRRGTALEHKTFTGAQGEFTWDTTNNRMIGHDGVNQGGFPHVTESLLPFISSVSFDSVLDLIGANLLPGSTAKTRSYYNLSSTDTLGAAFYRIVDPSDFPGTPDGYGDHALTNGNVAVLQSDGAHSRQYGAISGDATDNIKAMVAKHSVIYLYDNVEISDEIECVTPKIFHAKNPKGVVLRQTNATSGGINFNYPSLIQGGGIDGITIEAGSGWITSGFQGSGSSGVGLRVVNSNGLFFANKFSVNNFDRGIECLGSFYAQFYNFQIFYSDVYGISVGNSPQSTNAGNLFAFGKVSNFGFANPSSLGNGIQILASGGNFYQTIDVTSFNKGIVFAPSSPDNVLYEFFDTVLADTCTDTNWEFDSTSSLVWSISLSNCWSSFSTNGPGVVFKGSNLDSITWDGGRVRENGLYGVHLQSSKDVVFNGTQISSNSKLSGNTYAAVRVEPNVGDFSFVGCNIGNDASIITGHAENIQIAAGTSANFKITNCDLRNPGAGKSPIANGSSSDEFIINNNLPLVTLGTNTSTRDAKNLSSAVTVPSSSSVFIGASGTFNGSGDSPIIMTAKRIVTGFYIQASSPAGAGQSYTYTVYKNGSPTSMTGEISGDSQVAISVKDNTFNVIENDLITIEVVTSSGSTDAIHNGYISIER